MLRERFRGPHRCCVGPVWNPVPPVQLSPHWGSRTARCYSMRAPSKPLKEKLPERAAVAHRWSDRQQQPSQHRRHGNAECKIGRPILFVTWLGRGGLTFLSQLQPKHRLQSEFPLSSGSACLPCQNKKYCWAAAPPLSASCSASAAQPPPENFSLREKARWVLFPGLHYTLQFPWQNSPAG